MADIDAKAKELAERVSDFGSMTPFYDTKAICREAAAFILSQAETIAELKEISGATTDVLEYIFGLKDRTEAAEAEVARLTEASAWRPTHRHKKTCGEYQLDGFAEIQTSEPLGDYAKVAIYRSWDGRTWVRPVKEFADRFAALARAAKEGQ